MGRYWFGTNGENRNQLYREMTYDAKRIVASRKLAAPKVGIGANRRLKSKRGHDFNGGVP